MNFIDSIIVERYSEPGRRWHTMKHIYDMLDYCGIDRPGSGGTSDELFYAILWHDFVYVPGAEDNEELSAQAWLEYSAPSYNDGYEDIDREKVADMIRATKTPFETLRKADDYEQEVDNDYYKLIMADFNIFAKGSKELLAYEDAIFYEFQSYSIEDYRVGRIDALRWIKSNYAPAEDEYKACDFLISHVTNKVYNVGIYAGSFNPYHIGHEDIVEQAEKVFDKVIIAQGHNTDKPLPEELVHPFRQVIKYSGIILDILEEEDGINKSLVRGLRNASDVGSESNFRNALLDNIDVKMVYFFCDRKFEHISSSMIRGLQSFGPETYLRYLPGQLEMICPSCKHKNVDKDINERKILDKRINCSWCSFDGSINHWNEIQEEL